VKIRRKIYKLKSEEKTMAEPKYIIIEQTKPHFPSKNLIKILRKGKGDLIFSRSAFGPDNYKGNLEEMTKSYSHPGTGEEITFRPPRTSESVLIASCNPENRVREISKSGVLQLGPVVLTQKGIFVNTTNTEEDYLNSLLEDAREISGIHHLDNLVNFVPYDDTFEEGNQNYEAFIRGNLARVLEHTHEGVATRLGMIASPEFYRGGIRVHGFKPTDKPSLSVVSIHPYGHRGEQLMVATYPQSAIINSHIFGVLK